MYTDVPICSTLLITTPVAAETLNKLASNCLSVPGVTITLTNEVVPGIPLRFLVVVLIAASVTAESNANVKSKSTLPSTNGSTSPANLSCSNSDLCGSSISKTISSSFPKSLNEILLTCSAVSSPSSSSCHIPVP